jgi:hypothetical protein
MGKKQRNSPKRLFRRRRLPADVVRVIDRLTQDSPELRGIVTEAVAVFDSQAFWEAFVLVPPHQRAVILTALRDAALGLRDGKPCDFCPEAAARHVRFLAIGRS